jgi:hypothetical protein
LQECDWQGCEGDGQRQPDVALPVLPGMPACTALMGYVHALIDSIYAAGGRHNASQKWVEKGRLTTAVLVDAHAACSGSEPLEGRSDCAGVLVDGTLSDELAMLEAPSQHLAPKAAGEQMTAAISSAPDGIMTSYIGAPVTVAAAGGG